MAFDPDAAASPDAGIFGLSFTPQDAQIVLVPVPFEATTSYGGGTADGPKAILEGSRQVDLFDLVLTEDIERRVGVDRLPPGQLVNAAAGAANLPVLS